MNDVVKIEDIEELIAVIRDEKIIIDSDVAKIYDVATKEVNQAVSNNIEKFPQGYVFELTKEEKTDVVKNFDHLEKLKFSPHLPKAFTEKGLYMLATILKSNRATKTTIAIIETFSKIKELSKNMNELQTIVDKDEQQTLMQKSGELITEILDDDLKISDTETSIEFNFAVVKFKHTIKKKK